MNIVWTNEKIQERRQRLGYVISHLIKKTFDDSTQDYPVVRHELWFLPKNFAMARFTILSGPMCGICRNEETSSVDLLKNTHAGKKRWGLVFYGIKSKILAYYRLGSKDPTAPSTLDSIDNFIAEHGIPIMIITDSDGVLGAGKKWNTISGEFLPPSDYLNQINTIRIQSNAQYKT